MEIRRIAALVGCVAALGGIAACGSEDEPAAPAGGTTTAATGDVVERAQALIESASNGLSYSASDFPEQPEAIEPYGEWRGPTSAPAIARDANVQVILCTKQAVACVQAAEGVRDAGRALGWTVEVIDGAGTPEGYSKAFDTAFSRKPDAIIGIAVPALTVGDKLTEAKKRGIVTVATADAPPTGGEEPYQGYVSFREPFMESLLAYAEIARTDGASRSIVITDTSQPNLVEAMDQYKKVMKTCDGCEVSDVTWKITDAADPTKVASIVSGAVARTPDATSISVPYSIGLPAVIQALESSGKAETIKVLVKDADTVGLQALKQGQVEYNSGVSPTWAGWAATDQVVRGLADEPYLDVEQVGLGLVTFTQDGAPADGNVDSWDGMIDFAAEYKKAWGVG